MILVWDMGVRVFHWGLAVLVLSNQFLNEAGGDWHEWFGYLACLLILFRVVWAFRGGNRYASFALVRQTWPKRGTFWSHAREYLAGNAPRTLHHPPLAIIGMAVMLGLVLSLGLTGWMQAWDVFFGEEWLEVTHKGLANALLFVVIAHVFAVLRESWITRENLIASMIHGKKRELEK